jgi:SPP1 gp7 family putative phage head morphogenesis protein
LFTKVARQLFETPPKRRKALPLDAELARHYDERLQAAVTISYEQHDPAQAAFLRQNVQLFSQAKTASATEALSAALLDETGNIRSWSAFEAEVLVLHQNYNVRWLAAEYEHAVASAQMAARWQEFEPTDMLEYQTVGDERVRAEHRAWDGITRPADDAWWKTHYPPNGWLCRCTATVAAPGAAATPKQVLKALPEPDALFNNNVGTSGIIFPEGHPYFLALRDGE